MNHQLVSFRTRSILKVHAGRDVVTNWVDAFGEILIINSSMTERKIGFGSNCPDWNSFPVKVRHFLMQIYLLILNKKTPVNYFYVKMLDLRNQYYKIIHLISFILYYIVQSDTHVIVFRLFRLVYRYT